MPRLFAPMKPGRSLTLILPLSGLALGSLQAQEIQWQVINTVTPTIVPQYANQPAPFISVKPVDAADVPQGPTPEEIAAQAALEQMLSRVNTLISSKAGFRPDVSRLAFDGMLDGPNGRMVALNGKWVAKGARLRVRVHMSEALSEALNQLEMVNETQATSLREQATNRMATQNGVITITSITADKVTLSGEGVSQVVPIRQAAN